MTEAIAHTWSEVNAAWGRCVLPFVRPILEADEKGRPDPVASCVLVSWREKQYFLTAQHVIAEPSNRDFYGALYAYLPEEMPITGPAISAPDPYDIALVENPQGAARYLRLPRHMAFDVCDGEPCLIFGYQARAKCWNFDHTHRTFRAPAETPRRLLCEPNERPKLSVEELRL